MLRGAAATVRRPGLSTAPISSTSTRRQVGAVQMQLEAAIHLASSTRAVFHTRTKVAKVQLNASPMQGDRELPDARLHLGLRYAGVADQQALLSVLVCVER